MINFGALPIAQPAEFDQIILVFDNRLLGRKGTNVVASSEAPEGNLQAANLLTENRFDYWRSDSVLAASLLPTPEITLTFSISFGSATDVEWSSYHWSNNQLPWRDDYYDGDPDSSGTLLGTTDWMNPIVKSEPGDFFYAIFPWLLGPSAERISAMAQDMRLSSFSHLPSAIYGVTHIRRRFDCTAGTNGTVDFIQMSLPIAGRVFRPQINYSTGVKLGMIDHSIADWTAGGSAQGIKRPTDSELSFTLDTLDNREAFQLLVEWVRGEGNLARVFVYQEPAADMRLHYYDGMTFVGVATEFSGLSIDEQPGELNSVFAEKNITGITIQETE